MNKYNIGIDIGGTSIKIGLFFNDKLLKNDVIPIQIFYDRPEDNFIKYLYSNINIFLSKNKLNIDNIQNIGIGFPGKTKNNEYLYSAINLNLNKKINIQQKLNNYFGKNINILIENDANLAALGEYYFGNGKNCDSICLIIVGTGVGMGIIYNNQIIDGFDGNAGEIGHIHIDNKYNLKCNCQNYGCLETVSSGTGISNIYNILYKKQLSAKQIIANAKNNDKKALKVLNISFEYLIDAILIIDKVLNPNCFIISGGVSNTGNFILQIIKKIIDNKNIKNWKIPKIKLAKLKNNSGLYGAYALNKYLNENK